MDRLTRRSSAALIRSCFFCLLLAGCAQGKVDDGVDADMTDPTDGGATPTGCQADSECEDGVSCTTDTCDTATGECSSAPDDAQCADTEMCVAERGCELRPPCESDSDCDDDDFCNGTETCDPAVGCQAGTAPSCDDGLGCTDDSCDGPTNACANVPNSELCGNGIVCDGVETCAPEDGAADANGCVAGTAPDCDDGVDCTVDACTEAAGGCENAPDDGMCDDGVFCDGPEVCDPTGGCMEGSAPSCDDDVGCTVDSCDTGTDACSHTADHAVCLDGDTCDGVEVCDLVLDCVEGTPFDCSDGLVCTTDRCSGAGVCEHLGSDADGDGFEAVGCASGDDCDDLAAAVNTSATEVCDGVDNNCSGGVDDGAGMECALGSAPVACTTSCSTAGTAGCNAACGRLPCVAAAETCNDCDDDGDGMSDEDFTCRRGSTAACITSCATAGSQMCLGDCSGYDTCVAATESCNACDDDGDGDTDEGFTCQRGASQSCTTSCGTTGTETCQLDCSGFGACVAAAETCNDCDDDGNGIADDGFTCRQSELASCTTPCGTPGSQQCMGDCSGFGACTAATETCGNSCDDDGNGMADDGCGAPNEVCSGATVMAGTSGSLTDTYASSSRTVTDCGFGGELWYRITLGERRVLYLDSFGTSFDSTLSIRTSCGGAVVQCEDDDCGVAQEQLVRVLDAGTYYVGLHALFSSTTAGSVSLRWQSVRAGNGSYTHITGNGTYSGTTSGSGGLTSTCGGSGPEDGWYFTRCPGDSNTVSATTCSGTSFDTVLSVRSDGDVQVACDDDSCGTQSDVSGSVTGPGLYVIQVDGYFSGSSGSYQLGVSGL